ncbi:hypothetical protein N7456_007441 [Penicillium angulare]|uniref:Uncharacterized protein n=1 Tax=Penicillium angulare TaxID=116970 RepID=A0A9W9K8E9_9EURO|nr:hypothetical protein N7456_007441 [Penicillium angulare]
MAVYYASGTRWRKSIAIFICLFVSDRLNRPRPGRAMSNLITTAIHLALFVTPAVTCASLYGLSKRIRPMKPDTSSVLSVIGLASQAFVHVALFISMLMLLPITPQKIPTLRWKSFFALYNLYGWALVDNAVYALIQGRLLWMALRNRRMGSTHVQDRGDGDTEKPQLRPPTLVLGQAFT